MAFSGALTLTDLNDFISPGQACIKPVEQLPSKTEVQTDPSAASTEIRIDSSGGYYEVAPTAEQIGGQKLEQAQISLNDCLACSGCITSAESILITLQSHQEVLNFLETNTSLPVSERKATVTSIAPQSLASMAASLSSKTRTQVTPRQVLRRVRSFCKQELGFDHVFDTTFARHVALDEHVKEFLERREAHRVSGSEASQHLPMLASACPGWICYAEKAHAEMLPFISKTKSPQQIMGTLVKTWLGPQWNKVPGEIYHVSVMPCYDKKLEASRSDFYNEVYSTRDVDCVITTGELELLMLEKGWDLTLPVSGELDPISTSPSTCNLMFDNDAACFPELLQHQGSSSGSYLESIVAHLQQTFPPGALSLSKKQIRNVDYEEIILTDDSDGRTVFKGAKCYGFRNLQNVVRKVGKEAGIRTAVGAAGKMTGGLASRKLKKAGAAAAGDSKGYDYVEVMACPGGCVNGGGQLKPPSELSVDEEGYSRQWDESGVSLDRPEALSAKWGNKEWTKQVEKAYWEDGSLDELKGRQATVLAGRLLEDILAELCAADEGMGGMDEYKDERRNKLFRTEYKAVESEVIGLAVKW